jgi:hypothetical protein
LSTHFLLPNEIGTTSSVPSCAELQVAIETSPLQKIIERGSQSIRILYITVYRMRHSSDSTVASADFPLSSLTKCRRCSFMVQRQRVCHCVREFHIAARTIREYCHYFICTLLRRRLVTKSQIIWLWIRLIFCSQLQQYLVLCETMKLQCCIQIFKRVTASKF